MSIIDRHIIVRFLLNYALLFGLLFIFAMAIDVILSLDNFVDAARDIEGDNAPGWRVAMRLFMIMLDFEGPRLFQFFAYLNGLTAVGAMGFTLAQMVRHRELVAVMASGVSLYRVAMPFIVATFLLSVLQMVNQEVFLPRMAPLLLRDHGRIGEEGLETFEIAFTPDGSGNLLQAPKFDPQTRTLTLPTFLERDAQGRTVRRIAAEEARWSEKDNAWLLTGGVEVMLVDDIAQASANSSDAKPQATSEPAGADGVAGVGGGGGAGSVGGGGAGNEVIRKRAIGRFGSDLTPQVLLVRRYNQFASMLSLSQISQMLATPRIPDRESLLRYRYSRFSSVLVNMLILWLTLPCFLLREPANLLRQSMLAASLAIPASVGSAIGMMMSMPGIPPAASVFLPVVMLGFMCLFPWTYFKT